jgi:hypothetical protein
MNIRDLIVELRTEYGIIGLELLSLKKTHLSGIIERNNDDYFIFVAAMEVISKNLKSANAMRFSENFFDPEIHGKYHIEAIKKVHIANKVIAGESFNDEESKEVKLMVKSVEDGDAIRSEVQRIKKLLEEDQEGSITQFIGVKSDPLFMIRTEYGLEYLGK